MSRWSSVMKTGANLTAPSFTAPGLPTRWSRRSEAEFHPFSVIRIVSRPLPRSDHRKGDHGCPARATHRVLGITHVELTMDVEAKEKET